MLERRWRWGAQAVVTVLLVSAAFAWRARSAMAVPEVQTVTPTVREGAQASAGRLWVRGPDGLPVPVEVRTGLTDGTSTEILEGPLKEGDEVIVGMAKPGAAAKKAGGLPGPRPF